MVDLYPPDARISDAAAQKSPVDKLRFLAKFLRSPRLVGSVTPSSRFLTQKMVEPIQWDRVSAIAELGAGTGVFTRAVRAWVNQDAQVIVFEQDRSMRARLQASFPTFHHRANALELSEAVSELGLPGLDCILSGLPLAMFSRQMRNRLMDQVVSMLNPGGLFVQFQYSPQMLPQLRRRFSVVRVGFVPLNLPPAFVYVCQR